MQNRNYKQCKKCDSDCCTIWAACNGCYYYEKNELICPNCSRPLANIKMLRKHGCDACVPLKLTKYCNGRY